MINFLLKSKPWLSSLPNGSRQNSLERLSKFGGVVLLMLNCRLLYRIAQLTAALSLKNNRWNWVWTISNPFFHLSFSPSGPTHCTQLKTFGCRNWSSKPHFAPASAKQWAKWLVTMVKDEWRWGNGKVDSILKIFLLYQSRNMKRRIANAIRKSGIADAGRWKWATWKRNL